MRYLGSRWQRIQTYAALGAWSTVALGDDDELTWRDTPETLILGMQLGLIWSPQIALAIGMSTTPLNVLEVVVLAGLGASVAIGGVEGGEMYIDYITHPKEIFTDPEKTDAFIQASEITLGLVNPLGWLAGQVGQYIGEEISSYKEEIFKNRFLNWPSLPF